MNKQISDYIEKQKSPQKEVCNKLRKIILKTFPDVKEEMKWGVPVYDNGKFYIGAVKHGVNLGFSVKGLSEKEKELFYGNGKLMRNLKFLTLEDLDEKKVVKLLKLVKKKVVVKIVGKKIEKTNNMPDKIKKNNANNSHKFFGLVPIIFINLIPLYGIITLGWRVGDIFFWYWFEFLAGSVFAYLVLRLRWKKISTELKKLERKQFIVFFLMFFFYMTLFMLIAVMGDLGVDQVKKFSDYIVFWHFVLERKFFMLLLVFTGLFEFFNNNFVANREYSNLNNSFDEIMKPLGKKAFVVAIFYLILMIQYHATGSKSVPTNEHWYLMFEVITLIITRMVVDIVVFYKQKDKTILIKN